MPSPRYITVAPAVPLPATGRQVFTYQVPADAEEVVSGSVVRIPFGKRKTVGIVTTLLKARPNIPVKAAALIPGTGLTSTQMQLGQWITRVNHGSLGYTLRLFLPPRLSKAGPPITFPKNSVRKRTGKIPRGIQAPISAAIDANATRRRQYLQKIVTSLLARSSGQILILVPEKRFLEDWQPLPNLHAALPGKELTSLWHAAAAGSLRVVVGTQKALFLPWQKLQYIIVDEEQLPTHKLWDQYPRLDTRDAARQLAAIHGANLIYSASFPSLALYQAVQAGGIPTLLSELPQLHPTVFMLTGADRGQKNVLPMDFIDTLKGWLAKKQQVLLLLNRTGKEVQAVHRTLRQALGAAAKRITVATTGIFSENAPVSFSRVAWLFPEYTFTYPDFRSTEHGLVLLARLAQQLPAKQEVAVVTRSPQLAHQLHHLEFTSWYAVLLKERERLGYPPFRDAIQLTISAKTTREAGRQAVSLREEIDRRLSKRPSPAEVKVVGPFQALTQEAGSKADYHILLLGNEAELTSLYHDLPIDRAERSPHRIL